LPYIPKLGEHADVTADAEDSPAFVVSNFKCTFFYHFDCWRWEEKKKHTKKNKYEWQGNVM